MKFVFSIVLQLPVVAITSSLQKIGNGRGWIGYQLLYRYLEIVGTFLLNFSIRNDSHCVQIVRIRSYSDPHFAVFILNAGKCGPE